MAVIAPFRGITYNFATADELSRLMAPPYDIISEEGRKRYYGNHPNNVIRLILGEKKTGDSDWDNPYTRAAEYFRRWETQGILVRSERPCIYITSHSFADSVQGPSSTRWGILALVRIEEEGSGAILPHERTFSAHKDDRLRLMRSCNAHFSQIFSIYDDPSKDVLSMCRPYTEATPKMEFGFEDGSFHRMWEIADMDLHEELAYFFSQRALYIADGHHRYETSRNYRNSMRARYGRRPANKSYEFTMMYLCAMQDPGLKVLSSHRLLKTSRAFDIERFLQDGKNVFDVEEFMLNGSDWNERAHGLSMRLLETGREKQSTLCLCTAGSLQVYLLKIKAGMEALMGEDIHPALKSLDVLVLSRLILQKALGFTKEDLDNDRLIKYESDLSDSLAAVYRGDYRIGFMLNPTRIEQVKEVADNHLVMPRKSTYFYPKVLTGLVLNKIDPNEIIHVP